MSLYDQISSNEASSSITADTEADDLERGPTVSAPSGQTSSATSTGMGFIQGAQEQLSILQQSACVVHPAELTGFTLAKSLGPKSHPVALIFLFAFRTAAVGTYLLCGYFSNSYVFSVSGYAKPKEGASGEPLAHCSLDRPFSL